jgi:hypothetical protein
MHIDEILRPHRRCLSEAKRSAYQYFAHTADLSAFAGCSTIPLHLLNLIIGLSVDVMVSALNIQSA